MIKKIIKADIWVLLLGCALVAVSVSSFAVPNDIAAGGLTGLATIIFSFTGLPVGVSILVMNIPVFIIAAKKFGFKFLYKSLIATVFMSVFIDVAAAVLPAYSNDRLLCAIFGGALSGTGMALVFMRGATTGGVDIIAKLVNGKFGFLSIGNIILLLDACVVLLAAVAYGNIESSLYAAVLIFVQSKVIDSLIYGADKGRVMMINSKKYSEIAKKILTQMQRGVTVLDGSGAYSNSERKVILCAVRRYEATKLHKIVKEVDDTAFVVTVEAGEIKGEGFNKL